MSHELDPKADLVERLGDISEFEVLHNNVIVAVYMRPEKTKSGIILPDQHRAEDLYQSKCGLVVAIGPNAFMDPSGSWKWGEINIGDWVVFRPSDGWNIGLMGKGKTESVKCRRLADTSIEAVVQNPDMVF